MSLLSGSETRQRMPVSSYLDSLSSTVRDRVDRLSAGVAGRLTDWASRYPLVRQARIKPLALSVCASAPFSSIDDLVAVARVSLWVFTADDVYDEEMKRDSELETLSALYCAIADGRWTAWIDDELALALRDVVRDLHRFPLFERLGTVWARAFGRTLEAMAAENRYRRAVRELGMAAAPSYGQYLTIGRYSIGGPPHIWASIISVGDFSAVSCVNFLGSMERTASTCIRLANDLQSDAKEVVEGKVNSIRILTHQLRRAGWPEHEAIGEARRRVGAEIGRDVDRLARWAARRQTATGRPELAIENIARFVTEFYTRYDYHTFLPTRSSV